MSISSELAAVINEMAAPENFGETVTINGNNVPAIVADATHSPEYAPQGLIIEGMETIVTIPRQHLTTRPLTTSTLTVKGARRRILRIEEDETAWTLLVGSATS